MALGSFSRLTSPATHPWPTRAGRGSISRGTRESRAETPCFSTRLYIFVVYFRYVYTRHRRNNRSAPATQGYIFSSSLRLSILISLPHETIADYVRSMAAPPCVKTCKHSHTNIVYDYVEAPLKFLGIPARTLRFPVFYFYSFQRLPPLRVNLRIFFVLQEFAYFL